ncbi:hypothetical protein NX059_003776 [Plenodomus lindquistii]|nr:hypothetical protein NX059_003776 [Plenodomus lindquistii]
MGKLSAWVRKHLVFRSGREKKQSKDQLPFLPSSRRPLTPTSSSFSTATSPFFQLPYDIRHAIILMAFGQRTLHVDIVHREGTWHWRGGVCIRNFQEVLPSMRYKWLGPCFDACTDGMESRKNTGGILDAHDIGIMGFLLSCRQAYTEGINVLYSANCISIKTEPLLLHLPKLILHNRLASITSLEVIVEAHCLRQEENGGLSFHLDHLKPILDNVATHCRHLQELCLSFIVEQRHGHEVLDGPALPLVDAFWRSMQLRNMRVELPSRDYSEAKVTDPKEGDHPLEGPIKRPFGKSLWRSLDSKEPKVQYRSIERYPYPPLKLPKLEDEEESKESSGYWFSQGHEGAGPLWFNCGEPWSGPI